MLPDPGGERRLRLTARFGRPSEVLFTRQRQQKLELVDHGIGAGCAATKLDNRQSTAIITSLALITA